MRRRRCSRRWLVNGTRNGRYQFLLLANLFGTVPCETVLEGRVLDATSKSPLNRARVNASEHAVVVGTDTDGTSHNGMCLANSASRCAGRRELRTIEVRLRKNKK